MRWHQGILITRQMSGKLSSLTILWVLRSFHDYSLTSYRFSDGQSLVYESIVIPPTRYSRVQSTQLLISFLVINTELKHRGLGQQVDPEGTVNRSQPRDLYRANQHVDNSQRCERWHPFLLAHPSTQGVVLFVAPWLLPAFDRVESRMDTGAM